MALSNIFREPRREITESVAGLVVFAVVVFVDYSFGLWLQDYAGMCGPAGTSNSYICLPWQIGMAFGILLALLAFLALIITHALGDAICNALDRQGIHLRPRNRPTQN